MSQSVIKLIEAKLGRELSEQERELYLLAYNLGEQREFDRWADIVHGK
ncbi:hypothetical protein LCM23_12970 [Cytobacillus kochii]|nr:hypothetical protein [Cytobacillus kochii]MCA1027006.1 hypothetical protein [Cytobacillus kochii]